MANTFTSNYNLIKSEIGGDNQSWGSNLHTTLDAVDLGMGKLVEDQLMSGITSSAIDIVAGSGTGIVSTAANLKYFESVVVGDKIRIATTNTSNAVNGTPTIPKIYTVTAKTSADSITLGTQMISDSASTVTVAKVLEPVHINSGPIICSPLSNLSASTRTAGGVGVVGSDATYALVATGPVHLKANVTLGGSNFNGVGDTIVFDSEIGSDLVPSADNTYSLGGSVASGGPGWKNLNLKGQATIGTVAIAGGTIAGLAVHSGIVQLAVTGTAGSYTNFNIGSNGQGNKTVSSSAPTTATGFVNGDVWYEIA
jgi:hypothetical protein